MAGGHDAYFGVIGDGRVTALDGMTIQRCELGMEPCAPEMRTRDLVQLAKCDVDGDGACDASDARAVLESTRGSAASIANSCPAAGR